MEARANTTATYQLSALLEAYWLGAKAIFARLDSDIALEFLERYPTPQAAQRLGEGRLAAFLRRHGYSGRRTPAQLLTRLRTAPVAVDQLDPEVLADCIRIQVRLLRSLLGSIADLDRALAAAGGEHQRPPSSSRCLASAGSTWPDPGRGRTDPGPGQRPPPCRCRGWRLPVTKQSDNSAVVQFRWAANTRARNALGTFADNSRHASPWAARLYRQARRRGKRHPRPSAS